MFYLYTLHFFILFYSGILGPWFENWGRMVAVHPALSNEDRILITKQLLKACDSNSKQGYIPNQVSALLIIVLLILILYKDLLLFSLKRCFIELNRIRVNHMVLIIL